MKYSFNETELSQLKIWSLKIQDYYKAEDVVKIKVIVDKAINNRYLSEDDLYNLLELMKNIIPKYTKEVKLEPDDSIFDYEEYLNIQNVKYKRETDKMHSILLHVIFLQSSVHRKNSSFLEKKLETSFIKANKENENMI